MLTQYQVDFLNQICSNKLSYNVYDNVDMSFKYLLQIPVQFGHVKGYFQCQSNILTTLEGSPSIVEEHFECDSNQLTTLKGGPREVGKYYSCCDNKLTNLIGAPETHNHTFLCESNQLTSLEGCPSIIKGNLYITRNPNLHILYGIGKVEGDIIYDEYNDLNEWIISRACLNIFSTYSDIAKWIKDNAKYEYLLYTPKEINCYFSKYIINSIKNNIC